MIIIRVLFLVIYVHFFVSLILGLTVESTARKPLPLQDTKPMDRRLRALREGPDEVETTTEPDKNNCICSKIYDPVCASNGKSFYNLCQMECDASTNNNITIVHQGNCIPF